MGKTCLDILIFHCLRKCFSRWVKMDVSQIIFFRLIIQTMTWRDLVWNKQINCCLVSITRAVFGEFPG
jgi:hypothetical protein